MKKNTMSYCGIMMIVAWATFAKVLAAESPLDRLDGQPVDIAPWAYAWRTDLAVQEKPEACFIPRRLERMDRVYRTAYFSMSERELKGPAGEHVPRLLDPFPPQPKGQLQTALLWIGKLAHYQVELQWPSSVQDVPSPDAVDVRVYPTRYSWFGWTRDEILRKPEVSQDGHTWTYEGSTATESLLGFGNEMVAVFHNGSMPALPSIRVTSPELGTWKRLDVEIEWGFQEGSEKSDFDGTLETYIAQNGPAAPLPEDKGSKVTGGNQWQSHGEGDARRGITVPLLYSPNHRSALDSRVTIRTKTSGFTFRVRDLESGPILIPEQGVFVTKAGSGQTARQFTRDLAAKNLKSIRQLVREHPEAESWEEVMRNVRLSQCPAGTALPPFPQVPDPPMRVQVSDERWTAPWRAASFQLQGKHMWGGLAFEVARVAHAMDMIGLHDEANKTYQYFLNSPGVKPDGDYTDGTGALEWAKDMRHDMGYLHDGTHASTGRLLFGMAERYFLTGDKEWFRRNRVRMQAAADWIVRQRSFYMKDIPNRQDLLVAGLMPPCMLGDYNLPSCDWHWYYCDNAFSLQAIQRFADAVAEFDPEAGRKYHQEAEAFRTDFRRAIDREAMLTPVRRGRDGMYRTCFIHQVAYSRGEFLALELGSIQRPQGDVIVAGFAVAEPFAAISARDSRMVGAIDLIEEMMSSPLLSTYLTLGWQVGDRLWANGKTLKELKDMETFAGGTWELPDNWFWNCFGAGLVKASHNADIYLWQDDVPNFLRFWMNSYAAIVGTDGKMWEWPPLTTYTNCTSPDNGTAGWFMAQFRNLLVMEEGNSLWIARATPRAWLEQGKTIGVKNAPTYFGTLAYEIVSDVDKGKITATVEIPNRNPPKSVIVRFRHPKSMPIQSVEVNGKAWKDFNEDKETIELKGLTGKVVVMATY